MPFVHPAPLRPGDLVAAVAPSMPWSAEPLDAGVAVLEARGLRVRRPAPRAPDGFLAGTDSERADELRSALGDPEVRAVWCVRGGHGATRLLRRLDGAEVGSKWLVGFSDATALHAWAGAVHAPLGAVHGPLLTTLAAEPEASRAHLFTLLEGGTPPALVAERTLVPGRATGLLRGGNLTVLAHLLGTPWMPRLDGAVLCLEDVGERPYRVDRTLTQLREAGALRGVRALVFGRFQGCADPPGWDYSTGRVAPEAGCVLRTTDEVLAEHARALDVPALGGVTMGHGGANFALPLGARATVDGEARTLSLDGWRSDDGRRA